MKKSIFIKGNQYRLNDYDSNLPQHIIYCEVLGSSAERLFTNKISKMDIYVDLNSNLKKFYMYLADEKKKQRLIKILEGKDLLKQEDKELDTVLSFYKKCVQIIEKDIEEDIEKEYIKLYSKRNNRYIDSESFSFRKGFKRNKKYIMQIVDRLNEIQIHKFSNNRSVEEQSFEIMNLYDDDETLLTIDLKNVSNILDFDEINYIQNLLQYEFKSMIHIICNESQSMYISELLKIKEYEDKLSFINGTEKEDEYQVDDKVAFFKTSNSGYRITQKFGVIKSIEGSTVITVEEEIVPKNCLIKIKKYPENSAIKSPINWYGGKYYLGKELINIFPENHSKYVEVFGGAGHILFRKELAPQENIYNDLNKGLYNFFKALSLRSKKKTLMEKLSLTLYHQEVWEESETWEREKKTVELACKFYTKTMQSRSSNGGWSFTRDKKYSRRSMAASVSKWLGNIENNIHRCIEKLSDVIVENNSFEVSIENHDSENTLFYLDPPYVLDTRTLKKGYQYELTVEQHEKLVDILLRIRGKAVLSGYENNIYCRLERENFTRILVKEVVKSSVNVDRENNTGKEYAWINFELEDRKLQKYILREILVEEEGKNTLKSKEISSLELECKYIFKEDYRAFLTFYNGANLKEEIIDLIGSRTIDLPIINKLYGATFNNEKNIKKVDDEFIVIGETITNEQVLIKNNDEGIYVSGRLVADNFISLIKEYFRLYTEARLN